MPKKIPWLRVLVEGTVIVGSILVAFGIDAWWDAAQDRGQERNILAGLRADFEENERQIAVQLQMRERLVGIAAEVTTRLQNATPSTQLATVDSVLVGLLTSPTFDPITSTLDASLSSGQVTLIQSASVRGHLANWRRVLVGLHENELAVRDVVHSFLAPELSSATRLGPAALALAAPREMGDLTDPGETRSLRATPELEGAVGLYLFNSTLVQRDLRDLQAVQRALLNQLELELRQ